MISIPLPSKREKEIEEVGLGYIDCTTSFILYRF